MDNKNTFLVRFVCFLFLPLTDYGEHKGIFFLHAWNPDLECYVTTSAIIGIYRHFDTIVVETREAFYKLEESNNIRYINNIIRFFNDREYTVEMFREECKTNIQINKRGWRIF